MNQPYLGAYRITKLYGTPPPAGVVYSTGKHAGIDLVGDAKEVRAVNSGTVYRSAYDYNGWGKYVVIKQIDGLYAIYCHLSKSYKTAGQSVTAGELLGIEGATGQVTGQHLHFEIRKLYEDKYSTINPTEYLGIENMTGYMKKVKKPMDTKEQKVIFPSGSYKKYDSIVYEGHIYTGGRALLEDLFADMKLPYKVDWSNGVIVIKKK